MTWIPTFSGRVFDLENPSADVVHIDDIAHALAYQCRFNGHCREFYSVAQHSVLVADIVAERGGKPGGELAALLHDAAEAYLGDIVAPLKHKLPDFRRIEKRVEAVVLKAFFGGATFEQMGVADTIKYADLVMLATESRDLMAQCWRPWDSIECVAPRTERIEPLGPKDARRLFLERFDRLSNHK